MKNFFTSLAALFVGIFLSTQLNAQYCVPTGLSSTWDGIQRVATIGGVTNFTNSSGISASYTNYSGTQKVSVKKGSSFTLQITNSWQGNAWIDFNGDGDFTDPGEDLNLYIYKTTSSWGRSFQSHSNDSFLCYDGYIQNAYWMWLRRHTSSNWSMWQPI